MFFFDSMFSIVFVLFLAMFVFIFVKNIKQWHKNNKSPRLTVEAEVVCKRTNVSHTHHANAGDVTGAHGYHTSSSTSYYVTFQFESGDRTEFCVSGYEYGMMVEGDRGKLTFQGTRFLDFVRC